MGPAVLCEMVWKAILLAGWRKATVMSRVAASPCGFLVIIWLSGESSESLALILLSARGLNSCRLWGKEWSAPA